MKSILRHFAVIALYCTSLIPCSRAVEPGFVPLFDREHTDGWKQSGGGGFRISDGVATSFVNPTGGAYWYMKQGFADFVLLLEFKADEPTSNSGVFIRSSSIDAPPKETYEVQIYGRSGQDQPTGAIYGRQPPTAAPLRPVGAWNDLEIAASGQELTVRLNGQVVNQFKGNLSPAGYIGIQNHRKGPVQFRNVRIKDLSAPALAGQQPTFSTNPPPPPAVPIDPNQPLLETLSQQAPNASKWVLAPLDAGVPADIRQNVTYLREDLLDEAVKNPKASPEAYKIGEQLCNTMIAALDERDRTLVHAGFRAVEAQARTGVANQALEARRNYKMSWPQFAREESQRAELKSQAIAGAAVMAAKPKLEWSQRTDQIRPTLDTLYKQFRAALRQGEAAR